MPATKDASTKLPFPSEDGLSGLLGYQLRRASVAFQADLAETLRPFDLRMITYTALVLLETNPGLSQSQLAGLMDIERPNLVAIIDELQDRGLLTRDRSEEDRRSYALNLTDDGRTLAKKATQAVAKHEARLLDGLSDNDLRIAAKLFSTVRLNAERT